MRSKIIRSIAAALAVSLVAPGADAAGKALYDHWSDGKGEINTYALEEQRYGEVRTGHATLVYVAEELNRDTYVKVETDRTPQGERMYVIKLNHLRKFPTGLYDYSVMTTVFSVADPHLGHPPFQAARIVHTTQEWCGQVFQRLDLHEDGWHLDLRSYFEAEGDHEEVIPAAGTDHEDNLWVKIRELDEPWLAPGESADISLLPATWETRKSHRLPEAETTVLSKSEPETYETHEGPHQAHRWSWSYRDREMNVWIEADGAHRLLGWEDNRGGSGRLIRSERLTYWRLNDPESRGLRDRFALPSDAPAPGGS